MTVPYNPTIHIPDVNHWEGVIDFDLFPKPRRIITKLTEGRNFGDPLGGYNLRHARELGITPEAYHFATAWDDPTEQMRVYRAALHGVYWTPEEQCWLDFEGRSIPAIWRGLGTIGIRRNFRPFVLKLYRAALVQLDVVPGIYSRTSFWNAYVGRVDWAAEGLPRPKVWWADYGYNGEGSGITEPRWIDRITFPQGWDLWQFTDRGRAPGVPGALDLNREKE